MKIISRKEAKENGLTRYFTGKSCKHGHIAERFISYGCVECAYKKLSTPEAKAKRKLYDATQKAKAGRKLYANDPVNKLKAQKYYASPEVKARRREKARTSECKYTGKTKQYIKDYYNIPVNKARNECNSQKNHYKQASPSWADVEKMNSIYLERIWMDNIAKHAGWKVRYNVDHIIPFIHDRVCGLHNEFNIQIISKYDNKIKSNYFENN